MVKRVALRGFCNTQVEKTKNYDADFVGKAYRRDLLS